MYCRNFSKLHEIENITILKILNSYFFLIHKYNEFYDGKLFFMRFYFKICCNIQNKQMINYTFIKEYILNENFYHNNLKNFTVENICNIFFWDFLFRNNFFPLIGVSHQKQIIDFLLYNRNWTSMNESINLFNYDNFQKLIEDEIKKCLNDLDFLKFSSLAHF